MQALEAFQEDRRLLRRVRSSLVEVVVMSTQPGYTAVRTTCPDGQFWIPVRGELVVDGSRGSRRQRPFELLYYAPREHATRVTSSPTLSYGLRVKLSELGEEEKDASWTEGRKVSWDTRRTALNLIVRALEGADTHALDEAAATLLARASVRTDEKRYAPWLDVVKELLHADPSLSLLALSRAAGVVPAYLSAQFKSTQGVTVSAYRRRIMLQRTLSSGDANLSEAAVEAGFYDASHFHRACLAELGMKPKSIRTLLLGG